MPQHVGICYCSECKTSGLSRDEMVWVFDSYSIPYKLVCSGCEEVTRQKAERFRFDPSYAGECLEADDY